MLNLIYRFRRSNNFRLAVFWILAGVWLLANLLFFTGWGWDKSEFAQFAPDQQQRYNLYFHGKHETDAQLAGVFGFFANSTQKWTWRLWWAWFVWCVIYFPIAMREEVGRAYQVARSRVRAWVDLPDAPTQPSGGTSPPEQKPRRNQYLNQAYIFVREFFSAIIAELLGERMMAK